MKLEFAEQELLHTEPTQPKGEIHAYFVWSNPGDWKPSLIPDEETAYISDAQIVYPFSEETTAQPMPSHTRLGRAGSILVVHPNVLQILDTELIGMFPRPLSPTPAESSWLSIYEDYRQADPTGVPKENRDALTWLASAIGGGLKYAPWYSDDDDGGMLLELRLSPDEQLAVEITREGDIEAVLVSNRYGIDTLESDSIFDVVWALDDWRNRRD